MAGWKVIEDISSGNHQLIEFHVSGDSLGGPQNTSIILANRIRDRRVNWECFRTHLEMNVGGIRADNNSVREYNWWGDMLDGLRHKYSQARRKWQPLRKQPGQLADNATANFAEA
ncbi:hypothetical protein EVAR_57352_1 [Eumeta japonica]|uniref:Uncharacterized protein n=1 Tax=Eumeta variegata TaxID=151549 RepID=A0A4C1ZFN8_EUMVA|nr:hypothetical protein EVAR_57352_1 [Eumeta japonica]